MLCIRSRSPPRWDLRRSLGLARVRALSPGAPEPTPGNPQTTAPTRSLSSPLPPLDSVVGGRSAVPQADAPPRLASAPLPGQTVRSEKRSNLCPPQQVGRSAASPAARDPPKVPGIWGLRRPGYSFLSLTFPPPHPPQIARRPLAEDVV